MSSYKPFGRIGELVRAFGSAVTVAAAIERGRRPHNRDLVTRGINPNDFDRIRRIQG
jgi:hypothetical protein